MTISAPAAAALPPPGHIGHKYADEGHSAILHATALALPGARLEVAADATPKRLHIVIPAQNASRGGAGGGGSLLYTCKTCEGGPDVPNPVSINVTSCLFRKRPYEHPTLERARKAHPCRYFEDGDLARICAALGPADVRRSLYGWFCGEVESHVAALASQTTAV